MARSDFERELSQQLDFKKWLTEDRYGQPYRDLKEIAKSIAATLNEGLAGSPIIVDIVPGFESSIGQQLNVTLRVPSKEFQETLFRAYLPPSGYPIELDFWDEETQRCGSSEELKRYVLTFMASIRPRIAIYRDYAAPVENRGVGNTD